jgi:hypothetical protein
MKSSCLIELLPPRFSPAALMISICLLHIACTSDNLYAQSGNTMPSRTNWGKEFWVGYGLHQFMEAGQSNNQQMILYLSAEQAANVRLTIRGRLGTLVQDTIVPANSVIETRLIPKDGVYDCRLYDGAPSLGGSGGERLFDQSIHVSSDVPIAVYAHTYGSASSGAAILLPVDTYGDLYYSLNSKQVYASNCFSWVYVVASEDSTMVEITPSVLTRLGRPAGVPFTVSMSRGQIYQFLGANVNNGSTGLELTGSRIRSMPNSMGKKKPIAVFSGSSRTSNPISCGSGGGDNDVQQAIPVSNWGTRFLTAPLSGSTAANQFMRNSYKVVVDDTSTVVRVNGVVMSGLIEKRYYFFESTTADAIVSDKPVMVAQYMTGGNCLSGSLGDPEMIYLAPVSHGLKKSIAYRTNREAIQVNYLTLIVPTSGLSSLRIAGSSSFSHTYSHPNAPGQSVVVQRWTAANAQVAITCDSTFLGVTYGLGSVESYGYNIGYSLYPTSADVFQIACQAFASSFNPFPANLYSRLDSLPLSAGVGFTRYRWSTGDTTASIAVKYTGGYRVTVTNAQGCTGTDSVFVQFPDTVGLHVSTVQGACNRTVDVPVRATAFRNLVSMQGSINWNASDLRFEGVSGFGPTSLGLGTGNFGTTQATSGRLIFSWNDPNGTGASLADSTTLFTLRFTPLGTTARRMPVTVTSTPLPLEFYDDRIQAKGIATTAGAVDMVCDLMMSGRVLSPTDRGVRSTKVTLTGGAGPLTTTTDTAGNYSFKVLPGTYVLTPSRGFEANKLNGISTVDFALIQAHILQRIPFDHPYKLIAADANNSSSVTTVDISLLRRLLLGMDTSLPNNRLWAFVDGEQTFATPGNPFPFNATKTFTNQSTDVSHVFRGIKIGDVNYDRNPLLSQAPSGDTLRLSYAWEESTDGGIILRIQSRAIEKLMGWQGTLQWDASKLELITATPRVTNLGLGERWSSEGRLTLSWNDPRAEGLSFTEGMDWLELRFRKTARLNRPVLTLTEERLSTEAFNANYQRVSVRMASAEIRGNAWQGDVRVYPNPAGRMVNVEWKAEKRGEATVRVLDATGRLVHVHRGVYEPGVQRYVFRREGSLSVAGSWTVQVEVDGKKRNVPVVMAGEEPRP